MTPSDIVAAVCLVAFIACNVAIVVGETYHRHRKRRWKKRVQRFHEQQAKVTAPTASGDGAN
jgi:hypothetical protein